MISVVTKVMIWIQMISNRYRWWNVMTKIGSALDFFNQLLATVSYRH